jgi:hypothetical protein
MARKTDDHRLRNAAKLIDEYPGQKSGVYARMMGCHREIFNRLLVQLDDWEKRTRGNSRISIS